MVWGTYWEDPQPILATKEFWDPFLAVNIASAKKIFRNFLKLHRSLVGTEIHQID